MTIYSQWRDRCGLTSGRSNFVRWLLIPIIVFIWCGCSQERQQINDDNPYYKRGIELRQDGRYEDSVEAFKRCLYYSPKSFKAHLQLALIYEDHFLDFPRSLVHYQAYLEDELDVESVERAQKWLVRAEKKYFERLRIIYGNPLPETGLSSNTDGNRMLHPVVAGESFATEEISDDDLQSRTAKETVPVVASGKPIVDESESIEYQEPKYAFYSVKSGDSLSSISRKLLGDTKYWVEIYELNRDILKKPEMLKIGQRLRIPPAKSR